MRVRSGPAVALALGAVGGGCAASAGNVTEAAVYSTAALVATAAEQANERPRQEAGPSDAEPATPACPPRCSYDAATHRCEDALGTICEATRISRAPAAPPAPTRANPAPRATLRMRFLKPPPP